jgi:hypothetical protein
MLVESAEVSRQARAVLAWVAPCASRDGELGINANVEYGARGANSRVGRIWASLIIATVLVACADIAKGKLKWLAEYLCPIPTAQCR